MKEIKNIFVVGCGSVVSFVGLTRGDDNGIKVKRLEFDAFYKLIN